MVLSLCAVNLFPIFGISVYTHVSLSKIYIDIVIAVIIKTICIIPLPLLCLDDQNCYSVEEVEEIRLFIVSPALYHLTGSLSYIIY